MALTRQKKEELVSAVAEQLSSSKMTVLAKYPGTNVKAMQQLRREARASGTKVQVIKNRLVVKAMQSVDRLKGIDTSTLQGQLLYAFNAEDEASPAQALAKFAKQNPSLEFVGAISADGTFLSADDVKSLATLPTKQQLRGQLVGTIAAPLTGFMGVMSGNLRSVLYALNARADTVK